MPQAMMTAELSTKRTDGVRWEGEGAGGNGCGRRKEGGGGLTSARFLDRLAAPSSSPPLDERFRAWRRSGAWFASSECACHADSSGHPGKGASIASQLRGKTDEVKPLTLASLAPSRRVGVNDSVPQLHLELSEAATDELPPTSFHIQKKVCSACGYPSARLRSLVSYNWCKKMIRRKTRGTK
ncbi:hypothetical protein EMIHUDRAFT_200568 [Emiliania huxleyi CCMP1516]|uniref:Uncharacterized protein n=2 Tax=Emiliania huxleyi TaxID=2903 RepID=A0A0D3KQS8_EMIH1|nr:hypothetical protein EMIHUDRAFT_200568 [Emiliania huxleyi CCMP1516]EOD38113.1 hypothetical protein EMIHUDRAFT_200568 [Emiliania huxleyi CCMP1516]|eukprot:XP_005790542.1 hypothetical protein EMIHUDRAFT_200568 [Emiliania huxleyi CCMP1516]